MSKTMKEYVIVNHGCGLIYCCIYLNNNFVRAKRISAKLGQRIVKFIGKNRAGWL